MDQWFLGVLTLFAAYGVVALAERMWLAAFRRWREGVERPALSVVLAVRDRAAAVEGLLRELAGLARATSEARAGVRVGGLMVVDLDSSDDTPGILERLCASLADFPVAAAAAADAGGAVNCALSQFGDLPVLVLSLGAEAPAGAVGAPPPAGLLRLARTLLEPASAQWTPGDVSGVRRGLTNRR